MASIPATQKHSKLARKLKILSYFCPCKLSKIRMSKILELKNTDDWIDGTNSFLQNILTVLPLFVLIMLTAWLPYYAIYFLPILFIVSILSAKRRSTTFRLSVVDLLFVVLIFSEAINYCNSAYRPNTLLFILKSN
jgi:uncharacterized membrane protein